MVRIFSARRKPPLFFLPKQSGHFLTFLAPIFDRGFLMDLDLASMF